MAVVKCRELQVIAATAVGATISWLRQYLGRFGETYLEGVIFLEANCQCSCLNGFLVMKPMRIWAFNRNLFVVFLHWKLKRCMYFHQFKHSSSKNSTCILHKTTKATVIFCSRHFGHGIFPNLRLTGIREISWVYHHLGLSCILLEIWRWGWPSAGRSRSLRSESIFW